MGRSLTLGGSDVVAKTAIELGRGRVGDTAVGRDEQRSGKRVPGSRLSVGPVSW